MNRPVQEAAFCNLELRICTDIDQSHYPLLACMHNNNWGWLIEADPAILAGRIASGNPLFVGYAPKKADEKLTGFDVTRYVDGNPFPIILLETVLLHTKGDYARVPFHYYDLTDYGRWVAPAENPDTLLMVDLTAIDSRRGKNGN